MRSQTAAFSTIASTAQPQLNDDLAEWLRRCPAKAIHFVSLGSIPRVVDIFCSCALPKCRQYVCC